MYKQFFIQIEVDYNTILSYYMYIIFYTILIIVNIKQTSNLTTKRSGGKHTSTLSTCIQSLYLYTVHTFIYCSVRPNRVTIEGKRFN